jgi:hypothetical protein
MQSFKNLFVVVTIILFALNSNAQSNKEHRFAFYAGAGPNFYFNNLVLAKEKVNELNYSVVGRLMWEPEHNLSLGIESGFYRLYTVDSDLPGYEGNIHIANSAIPLQLIVSMKFLQNFYGSFSFGRAILLNKVSTTEYGTFNAQSFSLGDYTLSAGYKRNITSRFSVGAEVKAFYSGKLDDKNIALVFMGGFHF